MTNHNNIRLLANCLICKFHLNWISTITINIIQAGKDDYPFVTLGGVRAAIIIPSRHFCHATFLTHFFGQA